MSEADLWQYVAYRGEPLQPVLSVAFWFGTDRSRHPMILDTGTEEIVIASRLMQPWGIKPAACEPAEWVGFLGSVPVLCYPEAEIELLDLWPGQAFRGPLLFSEHLNHSRYGLLGRTPFLDHFQCRFGHEDGLGFCIRRY